MNTPCVVSVLRVGVYKAEGAVWGAGGSDECQGACVGTDGGLERVWCVFALPHIPRCCAAAGVSQQPTTSTLPPNKRSVLLRLHLAAVCSFVATTCLPFSPSLPPSLQLSVRWTCVSAAPWALPCAPSAGASSRASCLLWQQQQQ